MICHRCSHWNCEDDHRCGKCQTRLTNRIVESAFYSQGSLALQTQEEASAVAVAVAEPPPVFETHTTEDPPRLRTPRHAAALQQSLFSLRDAEKIVSIDGNEPKRTPRKPAVRRKTVSASYLPSQGVLEFVPQTGPAPRRLSTSVEARIFCEYPVASVPHRMVAGLYDLCFIGLLVGTFFGVLAWGCDGFAAVLSEPATIGVMGAAIAILALLYEAVFLCAHAETPGMHFAKLRLVDFDGRLTDERQMSRRILGGFISILPLGLGLLWALVDEEDLTWQDHISQTFPTPNPVE